MRLRMRMVGIQIRPDFIEKVPSKSGEIVFEAPGSESEPNLKIVQSCTSPGRLLHERRTCGMEKTFFLCDLYGGSIQNGNAVGMSRSLEGD